jgi:hypothetical protein
MLSLVTGWEDSLAQVCHIIMVVFMEEDIIMIGIIIMDTLTITIHIKVSTIHTTTIIMAGTVNNFNENKGAGPFNWAGFLYD